MNSEEKIKIISRNCQEIMSEESLKTLVGSGTAFVTLHRFLKFQGWCIWEPVLVSMGKIADFLEVGAKCRVLLADFHTFLNNIPK